MRKNNKGFSLVELIVAFAIIAIAGTAVYGLMSAGTNHFTRTGNDVGLQYEQQVVVNRLRDVLLESSDALSYDDSAKELVVYSQEDMGPTAPGALTHEYKYRVTKIYLEDTLLKYVSVIYDDIADVTAVGLAADDTNPNMGLFGEEVKDVSFDLSKLDEGKIGFTLTFESDGKEIISDQIVSLRNRVLNSDDPDEIFVSNTDFVNSFIQYIRILRNDVYLSPGELTIIVKNGSETVSVPFKYEITASTYSEYPYVGRWSLLDSVSGMSVDSSTGIVTVDSTVPDGTTNILKIESIDDPSKYQTCTIKVSDTGSYPVSLDLYVNENPDGYVDYVGYREYDIHPIITYTSGPPSTDSTLCRWEISPVLPDGCSFDPGRNIFTAVSTANDMTVAFTATLKAPKSNGEYLTVTKVLHIKDVGEYIANQQLNLSGSDSIFNCRGKSSTVLASWTNSTSTDFVYHWRVSAFGDSWSNSSDLSNFSKTVKFDAGRGVTLTSEGDGYYSSGKGYSYIYINTEEWLDWKKEYQVKVECYATDKDGKKYGIGNEVNRNYTGPVSMLVTYEPVKIILTPVDTFNQDNNASNQKKFIKSQDLKRVSNGKKDWSGNYERIYDPYEGSTVRTFEINARGVFYDSTHTSSVYVNTTDYRYVKNNAKFAFYKEDGTPASNETISGLFNVANYTYTNWATGFAAKMQTDDFRKYYNRFEGNALNMANKPVKVAVIYNAWDTHGNIVDTYYQIGDDYYNDSDLMLTRDYRFNIVYEPKKLNDPNYIEVYN